MFPCLFLRVCLVFLAWWDGIEIKETHPYLPPLLSPLLYMRVGRDLVWRCVGIFTVAVFKSEEDECLALLRLLSLYSVRLCGHHDWEAGCVSGMVLLAFTMVSPRFVSSQSLQQLWCSRDLVIVDGGLVFIVLRCRCRSASSRN